jgi:hypothetical protein
MQFGASVKSLFRAEEEEIVVCIMPTMQSGHILGAVRASEVDAASTSLALHAPALLTVHDGAVTMQPFPHVEGPLVYALAQAGAVTRVGPELLADYLRWRAHQRAQAEGRARAELVRIVGECVLQASSADEDARAIIWKCTPLEVVVEDDGSCVVRPKAQSSIE